MKSWRNIKLLAWFNFLTDFSLIAPVAIIYFTRVSGSFVAGMSIFSVSMFAQALLEVPTGVLSDYLGRKGVIVLGSIASVLSIVSYAIGGGYWILFVGALFEGLGRALYSGNNDAFLRDSLKDSNNEHEYKEYLGKTSSMNQAAAAVGALGSGVIAALSFPLLLWLSVIPQVTKLVISLALSEPKSFTKSESNIFAHTKEAIGYFIHNARLRKLSLASMIGFALGESGYQFRSAYVATLWPLWAVGLSKFLSSVGATLSFWWSGKVIKKFRELPLLIWCGIFDKVIDITALIIPSVFSPILLATTSLDYGVTEVAENNLLQNEFTDHQRATMSSLNALGGSLFFGIVALILGLFADRLGPATALLILIVAGIPVQFLHWSVFKNEKKFAI